MYCTTVQYLDTWPRLAARLTDSLEPHPCLWVRSPTAAGTEELLPFAVSNSTIPYRGPLAN